jgi:tetratricopeptide (TPR) repeat protein
MSNLQRSVALLCVVFAGCGSLSPSRSAQPTDPDRAVARLTAAWEEAQRQAASTELPPDKRESLRLAEIRILDEAEDLALEHPRHPPTLMLCAALSHELGSSDNALAYLGSLMDVEPAHPEGAILRSRIALEQGNHPFAITLLSQQIDFHPDHYGVREARAAALFIAGRLLEAQRDLQMAERLGAPAWRVAYNRGLIAETENRPEAAAQYYRECLSSNPAWTAAQERLDGIEAGGLQQRMLTPK